MPTEKPTRSTRDRILDAAHALMRTIGLARTTTKEIARAAGFSEAALYKHFSSKEELFVQVLEERLPPLGPLLNELGADPGDRSVHANLAEIATRAALFYESSFPIAASLYADPTLLRRHHRATQALGTGPRKPVEALARYLRAEREAGRIRPGADPDAAAALLLGACAQRAFLYDFQGGERPEQPLDDFASAVARTLLEGVG
ncbi:TetR/AcrR family transcriptional regulator [Streptomyces sp. N2-109]|uniref:TetR/AcrR family transcriptional regulator n=1 Tax=Streptomyces gossypii TaxID=2883101 RepID=A0ABT2JX03_9ACTN|nr:TetR/AcrR family transcriptional regulator [Streptomyces gossypii]MCT2592203.1 TetR/AcrR family transcriptional regulator [Streptomyces gossypii]